jgi:hypothetical protein
MNESPEMADRLVDEYIQRFKSLDKYDHMEIYHVWDIDGIDKALKIINTYANISGEN